MAEGEVAWERELDIEVEKVIAQYIKEILKVYPNVAPAKKENVDKIINKYSYLLAKYS